jgi:hypothetical protein
VGLLSAHAVDTALICNFSVSFSVRAAAGYDRSVSQSPADNSFWQLQAAAGRSRQQRPAAEQQQACMARS